MNVFMNLFVFLCDCRIVTRSREPQRRSLDVSQHHVRLSQHQQVLAVEIWVN